MTATFTVTIENTGETVLADISIDDPLATCDTTSIAGLAVGAECCGHLHDDRCRS